MTRENFIIVKLKSQTGFSLIELMVTVAIIAIIAAIAAPSYRDVVERNKLRDALNTLRSDIELARTEAIKRSENVLVSIASGGNGSWCIGITTMAMGCDCNEKVSAAVGYCELKRVEAGLLPDTNIASPINITFESRRATASTTSFSVTTENYSGDIRLNNVGRVKVCGGSLYEPC